MRILTHNMLCCNVKGCTANNFPLVIKATKVETVASEFNPALVRNLLTKLEWPALVAGCRDINIQIPEAMPADASDNEEFLRQLHHVLCNVHVVEGALECRNCHRAYPIAQGIPNMLLKEDEI